MTCGIPGNTPKIPSTAATTPSALLLASNCLDTWPEKSSSVATRVTKIPAAVEMMSAGIWATKPSPMVSDAKVESALPNSMSCCKTPISNPPMRLITKIMMPAIASPRTNLEAPSMEPKKSASWATSARRALASSCWIKPAFKSASIAICLPGIESRAKRAETSATRPEPLVITTKLMMVMTIKITIPTAKLPPIKKTPKASMTFPAASVPL